MSKTDTSNEDAKAILRSSKLPFFKFPSSENWEVPSRTKYLYYRLKSHAKYFLSINEYTSIEKIKADLASVYKLINVGKEHFQKELELKDFDVPPAIYLEYLRGEQSGQDWPQDFYIGYIMLAMLNVIEFENMMTSLVSNKLHDGQEADSVLLKAICVLMDAQVALELGISGYEQNRGDTYSKRFKYTWENFQQVSKPNTDASKATRKKVKNLEINGGH